MNKFKTKINNKLELSAVVQTVIDTAVPETELILDNYKEYDNYDIFALFTIDVGSIKYNTKKFKFNNGSCIIPTRYLLTACNLSYFIKNKEVPTVNITISLNLDEHRHNAQIFENKDTKKFSQALYDICDKLEDIDLRVKELEKDKEQELI